MSKICYTCFKPVNDSYHVCPYCGFDFQSYRISDRALHPGTVLHEKYIVGKTLGEGGFGITYLAWDRYLQTRIAIKEYYPSNVAMRDTSMYGGNTLHISASAQSMDFEAGLKRYVREASILSRFSTLPGIVSVRDFFYENGTAYIVMEYIEGISLKEYLKTKDAKLTSNEALNIIEPIIKSLAVLHTNKLLHRDISPDNIMISRSGNVKLIDFGAARYFTDDTDKSMTVVLKHGYAPIEQYSRKGEQGEWTDIYALCAVLYRMVTGVVPDESIERINQDSLIPVRKLNKKVPKHIAKAIERGLSIKPEDRQQDMQELYSELYLTASELKERKRQKTKSTVIIVLIVLIVLLIIMVEITVMLYVRAGKNKKSTEHLQVAVHTQEELPEGSTESIEISAADESEDSGDPETGQIETETAEVLSQDQPASQPDSDRDGTARGKESLAIIRTHEDVAQQTQDTGLQHAVVVTRDGYLNGKSEDYTLGMILNSYSDTVGSWYGTVQQDGSYDIFYEGTKNGDTFTVEFEVYADDTFRLIGATLNNAAVESYSTFFQQILDEVGV